MRNHKLIVGTVVVLTAFIAGAVFTVGRGAVKEAAALEGFAQCLTQKGFTMYGAYWCPHCQNEKAAFGDAFKNVNYVECTKEPNRCVAAKIDGYPTWIGPEGLRLEGEQGVKGLSQASGCAQNDAR